MTILDRPAAHQRPIPCDTELAEPFLGDIVKWESITQQYFGGHIDEDVYKTYRLTNGVYGQRQGGRNQMVRMKVPYGSIRPEQLEMIGYLAEHYSRGWAHITTRQNLQMHFVQLGQIGEVLRLLASVGLTTRESCGDTVRNIGGCHLAGACPYEILDISPWAEAAYEHFVRNPIAQRLPRKFKINFSGCDTDCGQAMFNDVGVVAAVDMNEHGKPQSGFRVYVAGGLGANPHAALALEDFTPREDLLPTIEAILRVFDQAGNRDNRLRARMKWLVDTLGIDEVRRRVLSIRRTLIASTSWPGGLPDAVVLEGDEPAGQASDGVSLVGHGAASVPVTIAARRPVDGASEYADWERVNVVRGTTNGTVSAYAHAPLGDITTAQFRALADAQRALGASVRLTNRQNLVFRDLQEHQLGDLYRRLAEIAMASAGAELLRDVVACPGADTCNLAVTQSRGLAEAITDALEEAGLAEVPGLRINISGCMNSCGQHHVADIGFFGIERRVEAKSAPGYQLLLGGHVGQEQIKFGSRALRLPAKNAPHAVVRIVERYVGERDAGETFATWLERTGGASAVARSLRDLDRFDTEEHFADYNETGPFAVAVGESECL
ncbi:nitrite/sulfite reductase [Candidatus Poriferisodalis sp.]|uniref:nitrite/sulfite reductase n=1 Tax=Candidatus Poriferisodalis sp. TaxID=3101277 RepID=UPI003D0CB158